MAFTRLMFRSLFVLAAGLAFAVAGGGMTFAQAGSSDIAPPHVDESGLAGYREFLAGGLNRAFAIAPGGAWSWVSDMPDPDVAESEAIRACSRLTDSAARFIGRRAGCVRPRRMGGLLGAVCRGRTRGGPAGRNGARDALPDLVLTNPDGDAVKLSDLRGRIVFLHFWGSWCAPCQVEFPELQGIYDALKGDEGVAFVFVQAREDIDRSRRWAGQRGFAMPFYDSGARGPSDRAFGMAGGDSIEDRIVAPRFPATYVLDSQGLVIFSQFGPQSHWAEYEPFLSHASEHRPY